MLDSTGTDPQAAACLLQQQLNGSVKGQPPGATLPVLAVEVDPLSGQNPADSGGGTEQVEASQSSGKDSLSLLMKWQSNYNEN